MAEAPVLKSIRRCAHRKEFKEDVAVRLNDVTFRP